MRTLLKIVLWIVATLVVSLLLSCFTIIVYLSWLADPWDLRTPTAAHLSMIFNAHQPEFEQLSTMMLEDRNRIGGDISIASASEKIGGSRGAAYAKLLNQIGPVKYVMFDTFGAVEFVVDEKLFGPLGTDSFKGIAYAPDEKSRVGEIVDNIDAAKKRKHYNTYFSPLGRGWFLFYEEF